MTNALLPVPVRLAHLVMVTDDNHRAPVIYSLQVMVHDADGLTALMHILHYEASAEQMRCMELLLRHSPERLPTSSCCSGTLLSSRCDTAVVHLHKGVR